MGLFDKLFGRKKEPAPSTGELARERLTLMLVHDRLKLTPDLLDRIKGELLEVISKYVEIDESGVDVELTHSEHSDKLVARMPVRRQRIHFERDVLEAGMGNPLVAAAALAKIHQAPGEAASVPEAAAPSGDATPAAAAPEAQAAPAAAQDAPAAEAPADAPAAAAEKGAAETPAAPESGTSAPAAAEAAQPAAAEVQAAPAAFQEAPAAPAEAKAAPAGEAATPGAAAGSAPVEAPAPAATPTKG
jgi:cell division topological specificity factor MinE